MKVKNSQAESRRLQSLDQNLRSGSHEETLYEQRYYDGQKV
jgi:hypothetical protein